jgi:hypothetical protein
MLNTDELIDGLRLAVYQTAIDSVMSLLTNPPGRRPRADLIEMSAWFHSLDEYGRERVREIVRLSVDNSLFDTLAVLDGVMAISNDGAKLSLSSEGRDLNPDHDLHDRFRFLIDQERGYDS